MKPENDTAIDLGTVEAKIISEEIEQIYIKSEIDFVIQHNGFRPGCMHVILGPSGGGKSTLSKTLILDSQKNLNGLKPLGIWYSEEGRDEIASHYHKANAADKLFGKNKINFYSETDNDNPKLSLDDLVKLHYKNLEKIMASSSILFFDNITTSCFYDLPYQRVSQFVRSFKSLIKKHNIPVVIFAHTDSRIKEGAKALTEQNDIRGPKNIVNISEIIYILQQFHTGEAIHSTLRIVKSRMKEIKQKIYYLYYDSETSTYHRSQPITFADLKAIYEKRNTL